MVRWSDAYDASAKVLGLLALIGLSLGVQYVPGHRASTDNPSTPTSTPATQAKGARGTAGEGAPGLITVVDKDGDVTPFFGPPAMRAGLLLG